MTETTVENVPGLAGHTGNRAQPQSKRPDPDLYETPSIATRALLTAEKPPMGVWEPAAGKGAIANILLDYGHILYQTDLYDHGVKGINTGIDFLEVKELPFSYRAIITNPPFNKAPEFLTHALALKADYIALLLRFNFLARINSPEIDSVSAVYLFSPRLPRMHRDGWEGPTGAPTTEFCWAVWDSRHRGPATFSRLKWKEIADGPA